MSKQQTTTPEPWPEGVTMRVANDFGATVDLKVCKQYGNGDFRYGACTGCDYEVRPVSTRTAREDAQAHAEKCRALPRPSGVTP
jgi:hypothetical protein